jgi:probable rRNA maturation factor
MLTKSEPQVTELVDFVKGELGIPEAMAVNVTFVDEDVMTDLHVRYRGLPGPTDVLSFSIMDVTDGPVDPKGLRDQATLGVIVIYRAFIARNAQSQLAPINIDAYVIHAMLHLMDHNQKDAVMRSRMLDKEEELAKAWCLLPNHGS